MLTEGVYDLDEATYHGDPCPEPSLSASIAGVMLNSSPRHAWIRHPRLNPFIVPNTPSPDMDFGTACHRMLFECGDSVVPVDAEDWRKKEAQRQREEAREAGCIALLRHRYEDAVAMVGELRYELDRHEEAADAFTDGKPEQTMIWREDNGIWCRARVDWLPNAVGGWIDDYKTTGGSASGDVWARQLYTLGDELQAAFYARGYFKLFGVRPRGFRFVVQENEDPYASSVVVMDDSGWAFAVERVAEAIGMWKECLQRGRDKHDWPAYPRRVAYVSPPAWMEYRWADRKINNEALLYRADDHPQGRLVAPEVGMLAGFGMLED